MLISPPSRLGPCARSLLSNLQRRATGRGISSFGDAQRSPRNGQSLSRFSENAQWRNRPTSIESKLARYKVQLAKCSEEGFTIRAFRICRDMKVNGVKPDLDCYNLLLLTCAKKNLGQECLALLDDMSELRLIPNVETYNNVLAAQRGNMFFDLRRFMSAMEAYGVIPNAQTYHQIIAIYHASKNLEMCLQCYGELNCTVVDGRPLEPQLATIRLVLDLAVEQRQAQLALDIAQILETSWRRLEPEDWLNILAVSASCYLEEGIVFSWKKTVEEFGVTPDEGLCMHVLNAAAGLGLVEIALRILQILLKLEVPLQEYHLAPLVEAHCQRGSLSDAIAMLNMMQTRSGLRVSSATGRPVVDLISDVETLDQAWQLVENSRHNDPVGILTLDVLLHAAANIGDLQRGIGIYKALPEFQAKPTVNTFNHLLRLCVREMHKELGLKILQDLRDSQLTPNANTYEMMIFLCLTQNDYEDTFHYLEEMKSLGFQPSFNIYHRIIRKCIYNKDERWQIALDELREWGYTVDPKLQEYIASKGTQEPDDIRRELEDDHDGGSRVVGRA